MTINYLLCTFLNQYSNNSMTPHAHKDEIVDTLKSTTRKITRKVINGIKTVQNTFMNL